MRKLYLLAAVATLIAAPAFAADDDTLTIGMTLSQTGPLDIDCWLSNAARSYGATKSMTAADQSRQQTLQNPLRYFMTISRKAPAFSNSTRASLSRTRRSSCLARTRPDCARLRR